MCVIEFEALVEQLDNEPVDMNKGLFVDMPEADMKVDHYSCSLSLSLLISMQSLPACWVCQ